MYSNDEEIEAFGRGNHYIKKKKVRIRSFFWLSYYFEKCSLTTNTTLKSNFSKEKNDFVQAQQVQKSKVQSSTLN